MTTEEIQLQSFQIIAGVGCARSCYIDAIHLARDGKFEEAEAKIAEDQLMSAEGFGILAKEFVDVYRKMGA